MTPIVCQAPGKLVLFGEFAVLAGHQALVTSVARFARTTITPSQTFQVQAEHFGTFNEGKPRAPNTFLSESLLSVCRRPNLHRNKYKGSLRSSAAQTEKN